MTFCKYYSQNWLQVTERHLTMGLMIDRQCDIGVSLRIICLNGDKENQFMP